MKKIFNRLLKRPKRLTITFYEKPEGGLKTTLKMDRSIPVAIAIHALQRVAFDLKNNLTNKAHAAGLDHRNSKTRGFIAAQKVGDVL